MQSIFIRQVVASENKRAESERPIRLLSVAVDGLNQREHRCAKLHSIITADYMRELDS